MIELTPDESAALTFVANNGSVTMKQLREVKCKMRAVNKLIAMGRLVRVGSHQTGYEYTLPPDRIFASAEKPEEKPFEPPPVTAAECREAQATRIATTYKNGKPRPKKLVRVCLCGCDQETAGGHFRPGHDSILKSAAKRAVSLSEAQNKYCKEKGWTP